MEPINPNKIFARDLSREVRRANEDAARPVTVEMSCGKIAHVTDRELLPDVLDSPALSEYKMRTIFADEVIKHGDEPLVWPDGTLNWWKLAYDQERLLASGGIYPHE